MHLVDNTDFHTKMLHRPGWKWFRHWWGPPPWRNGPPTWLLPGQCHQFSLLVWSTGGAALGAPTVSSTFCRDTGMRSGMNKGDVLKKSRAIRNKRAASNQVGSFVQKQYFSLHQWLWQRATVNIAQNQRFSAQTVTKRAETCPLSLEAEPFPLNPGGYGGLHGPGTHLNAPQEDAGPAPALEKEICNRISADSRYHLSSRLLYYHLFIWWFGMKIMFY